jgi:hypothetical protein
MAKKGDKRRESNGKENGDRCKHETVFDTFFASVFPRGSIIAHMAICKRQIQLTSRVVRKPLRLPKKPRKRN